MHSQWEWNFLFTAFLFKSKVDFYVEKLTLAFNDVLLWNLLLIVLGSLLSWSENTLIFLQLQFWGSKLWSFLSFQLIGKWRVGSFENVSQALTTSFRPNFCQLRLQSNSASFAQQFHSSNNFICQIISFVQQFHSSNNFIQ